MSLTVLEWPHASNDPLLEQDKQARLDALDTTQSFLVQAPAGSGKTELLTQRLLALLSVVEKPEQVLAITFTVAATAEMRRRVIDALKEAGELIAKGELSEKQKHAIAALEQSQRLGWNLLQQPQRLNIQTIDSLCLRIAYEAPLLSRLGGQLQPTEDAEPLYALAARRTVEQLGGANEELSRAMEQLLRLRDVSLPNCEALIAKMLGKRDQWLEESSSARSLSEAEWADLRQRREEPFHREHARVRDELRTLVAREPDLFHSMLQLAAYACNNDPSEDIHGLAGMTAVDALQEIAHFSCVRTFLLVKTGTWRRGVNKNLGFPTAANGGSDARKAEFAQLIERLSEVDGLREALCDLQTLPNTSFSEDEWQTVRSIFTVLLHAAAELRFVFAERSLIDFVEAGITAEHALRNDDTRRRWSEKIHHLLVDEFQDTSRRQYTLLKDIVRDWDMSDNRTCFLVGDPMQSIYLFRSAELALFDEVRHHGFGAEVPGLRFIHLTLSRNFRSTAGIVAPINAMFSDARASRFTPALADPESSAANALHLHTEFLDGHADEADTQKAEADHAVAMLRSHLPALEKARADRKDFRIGVLVRSRKHIGLIASALRAEGIPYRAVDIETLNERQEIRDLQSLMRALTQPMDRIAWLAVLRAPWCGLALADLHTLSGSDDKALQKLPVRELLDQRIALLSEDGQLRASRVQQALQRALATRFSGEFIASPHGFASWLEQTWMELGGPHCLDAGQAENVQAFFGLLATFKPGGLEAAESSFDKRLERLFAQPDPRAPENRSVQLMTIHKAKGLGFNVVLVPQLDKTIGQPDTPLLRWLARTKPGTDQRELLIAPIGAKGDDASPNYKWLGELQKHEELAESSRLLYVACTRARSDLHLCATLKQKSATSLVEPSSGTLLKCGWNYLRPIALEQWNEHLAATEIEQEDTGLQLAASADSPAQKVSTQEIRRLPANWLPREQAAETPAAAGPDEREAGLRSRIGSLESRARGVVLHALFESLASLSAEDPRRSVTGNLAHWKAAATALLRQAGLHRRELAGELKSVITMLQTAASDPEAQWILSKRPYARNETSWTVQEDKAQATLRCDRVFLAGNQPLSEGEGYLWIVDYKTADGDNAFLLDERRLHEPQLQRYAEALRAATKTSLPVRLALYYPALRRLLWWEA